MGQFVSALAPVPLFIRVRQQPRMFGNSDSVGWKKKLLQPLSLRTLLGNDGLGWLGDELLVVAGAQPMGGCAACARVVVKRAAY
jgi:hypothetical protein